MIEHTSSVSEHAISALRQVGHFVVDVAPYVLLVLIGHTATSIDHHYRDWSWPTYLVSCSSSFLLGIVLFCLVSAFAIPQMVGYALAVFRNGLYQTLTTDYTVDGTEKTVTFVVACNEGDIVNVIFNAPVAALPAGLSESDVIALIMALA